MAYIGQPPFQEYSSIPTKDRFTGDGSTVAFDLASAVPSNGENGLEVFVNNVRQEPGTGRDFTLGQDGSGDFKRITFASAPTDTHIIYVINDKTNTTTLAPLSTDLNGSELILDADADTSITADTDDRIDIKISGADDFTFSANAFNVLTGSHATFADSANAKFGTGSDMLLYHDGNNSYITNAVGALKIATESSGIAVTIGHTTSQVTIADNLTVGGDLDVTGSFDMSDANITNIGSIALDTITNDGTDITLDSSGDIVLDADGDNITLKAGGTTYGDLTQSGGELIIKSGSTPTTALTFAGANATLAGTLGVGAITGTSTIQGTTITATTAFVPDASDGAALGTTALEFSDLFLADGAVINFGDDQDVSLTHVVDTGLLLSSTDQLQFGDSGTYIFQSADGVLDLVSDTEIEINATTIDINGNVEISGTATTTGVHTFTAVPVLPANSIDSAHYVDGSIDNAHIADDQIDSEHYADGSIDTAHIADLNVTGGKLALDHRSAGATDDVKTGNQNDYLFFDADVGISFFTANAEDMRLEDDGDLHVDNDVIAFSTTISDATLKYNINPVEFALDKIKQLKGVTFNYFKNDKESAGLLAQDVEKVLPSAVSEKKLPLHTGDDKAYKTLHYDSVTAILVEAIKELTAKVEKLENK